MNRHVTARSLDRTRWFADVSAALIEADRLLHLLEVEKECPVDMVRLRQEVQSVRSELELFNRVTFTDRRVIEAPWPEVVGNR